MKQVAGTRPVHRLDLGELRREVLLEPQAVLSEPLERGDQAFEKAVAALERHGAVPVGVQRHRIARGCFVLVTAT
jgi:hypothetical protein